MMAMAAHRPLRFVGVALTAVLCIGLAGCENFDPALLFPDTKKPLPGERRLVFPEGVPGVVQGVPPELMRGANQQQDAQAAANAPPPQQAEEKPKPKAKPKRKATARQPAQEAPQQQPAQQAQPAKPAQSSPWPSQQQAQPQQPSPWPTAPQPGTFTR